MAALALLAVGSVIAPAQPEAPAPDTTRAVPAHRQADNVAIITIDEPIDRITAYSFQRRLEMAEAAGADAVVVELDTPGGEVGAVIEICDAIRNSAIDNSVAWINPEAHSGGAIIALACKEIITAKSVKMGDALPIAIKMGMISPMDEVERQKVTAPLIGEVVSSARLRGWDEYVVQGFVALGVELWWVRDLQTGETLAINEAEYRMLFKGDPPRTRPIIPSAPEGAGATPSAPDEDEVGQPPAAGDADAFRAASPALERMQVESHHIGEKSTRRTISEGDFGRFELIGYLSTGDAPLELDASQLALLGFASNVNASGEIEPIRTDAQLADYFGAENVRRLSASWSERMVTFFSHPIARGVLIVVFLLALFLEMSHPGIGLPGAIAVFTLLGLLAPPALIGMANWWEIGAIIAGILLIFMEIFVIPGFGVAGILGLLALFGGMLGTFVGESGGLFPDSPQGRDDLLYGLATITLSSATAGIGMYYIAKHFGSIPLLGRLVLTDVSGEPGRDAPDDLLSRIPVAGTNLPRIGVAGRTVTPLRPSGRAEIDGRVIDVVSDIGYIDRDEDIRVVAADSFRVVVAAIEPDGPDGDRGEG